MRYAGLLRAVNVGGNRLAMADLRRVVEGLGHEEVKTYLQSGNVVFTSSAGGDKKLAEGIEEALGKELGLQVPVLVRSGTELADIVEAGPFEDDPAKVLVVFLGSAPAAGVELKVPAGENIAYVIRGKEVFLHFPDGGYGKTKFTNAYLEKALGSVATTRNWRSVTALRDLTGGGK